MIKQNIFIVNFDLLYEILEEIKDNLSFNIVKFNKVEDFLKSPNLSSNDLLISQRSNLNSFLSKGVNKDHILFFEDIFLIILDQYKFFY